MAERIEKNIRQIFENTYKIPLYQRNFAWEDKEVEKLLQDIYQNFSSNKESNYFVGSLTTLKRRNGEYEVVDGQQRLTVLSLITRILNKNENSLFNVQKLFYDSRPEVDLFLNSFYKNPDFEDENNSSLTTRFKDAIFTIKNTKLDTRENNNEASIGNHDWKELHEFKKYFEENVLLVCVEIPEDTDVASYFEIMNNRGLQLQDHEIIKARLMSKIKSEDGSYDIQKQKFFATVWDACSQMDCHVQENFEAHLRKILFSGKYDSFCWNVESAFEAMKKNSQNKKQNEEFATYSSNEKNISDIIDGDDYNKYLKAALLDESNQKKSDEEKTETKFYSIIDFPNFLMHVFKSYYEEKTTISLHDKYLIMTYNQLEKDGLLSDPMEFAKNLLWCRVVFDRFVVKTTDPVLMDWSLKHAYLSGKGLKFGKTFGRCDKDINFDADGTFDSDNENDSDDNNNEICEKILSMLQVTFRSKYYKNFLQYIFRFFKKRNDIQKISAEEYVSFLNFILLYRFELLKEKFPKWKNMGEKTPHYALNFIDYLYWYKCLLNDGKISGTDYDEIKLNSFVFRNLNSVEHHLARNLAASKDHSEGTNYSEVVNNLGNLYLLGKNDNSRLNDRLVEQKIMDYYDGNDFRANQNLGANRQIMYRISKAKNWTDVEIKNHQLEVVQMMEDSYSLLGISKEEVERIAAKFNISELDFDGE